MKKRLYRSAHDRMLAGVCGGIAEYFQIDPAFIIGHTEHITAVFILLDISAWKIVLHANLWRRFSVFLKIIPEHPLPQS